LGPREIDLSRTLGDAGPPTSPRVRDAEAARTARAEHTKHFAAAFVWFLDAVTRLALMFMGAPLFLGTVWFVTRPGAFGSFSADRVLAIALLVSSVLPRGRSLVSAPAVFVALTALFAVLRVAHVHGEAVPSYTEIAVVALARWVTNSLRVVAHAVISRTTRRS
jgi:hypothetical protein